MISLNSEISDKVLGRGRAPVAKGGRPLAKEINDYKQNNPINSQ